MICNLFVDCVHFPELYMNSDMWAFIGRGSKKEKSIFFSVLGSFLTAGKDPPAPENANCHTSISKQRPGGSEDGCQDDLFFT